MAIDTKTVIEELEESAAVKNLVAQTLSAAIAEAAEIVVACFRSGGKVLLAGNGGSAADAQHLAAEFVGRFLKDRDALPAIALTTDTSILTAVANDYGYEDVFSRQVEALGSSGDVLVAITTSGSSPSIVRAVVNARAKGMRIIILTGKSGAAIVPEGDVTIAVPSNSSPRIQEAHITIGHIICRLIEQELFA